MNIVKQLNNDEKEFKGQPAAPHCGEQEKNEIIQPAVQEKNVKQTTFMLIVAIAVVFAVIWFIHKRAAPAQTTAAGTDQQLAIETAIAQLTGLKTGNVNRVDELVKKFYEFADFGQIKPQQLKKDPFSSPWIALDKKTTSSELKENNGGNLKNDDQKMQIQSILQSKYGNCCMIDDTLLYKGDKINGFEVIEIGSDFVRLRAQEHNTILYLQTE